MLNITVVVCSLKHPIDLIEYIRYYMDQCKLIIVSPQLKTLYSVNGNIQYIKDSGTGLAGARNLALMYCTTEYIFYLGDDNKPVSMDRLVDTMVYHNVFNYQGSSLLTRSNNTGYLGFCLNTRFKKNFRIGSRNVIGTPFLFRTNYLKEFWFDNSCIYSDDTDLCERIRASGGKVGIINVLCYEKKLTLKEIINKFRMYGKSDYGFYKKYSKKWKLVRKVKSWLHPLKTEWISDIRYFPFYVYIVFQRYYGWIKSIM